MALISNLGHVGIICDDFLKMRDFYTQVLGLTITDKDPDGGVAFSALTRRTSTTS